LSTTLSAIGFLAPWMAWGVVAAIGLPVAAHWLSRTRYREMVFPAARFVQQAVAAASRIESPRDRLLMLLRWLVLLAVVAAFMRPQWSPTAVEADPQEGVALVVLVDASVSMRRTTEGASLFERARREATELIQGLDPARDVAAIVCVDHAPASLLPEATARRELLLAQLEATQPSYGRADWTAAGDVVQRLLVDQPRPVRLVTVSDQQGDAPRFEALADRFPDLRIDHLRLEGPTENTAIRLVGVEPYPAIRGQPTVVRIEAQHFGERAVATEVAVRAGSVSVLRALRLDPGERALLRVPLPATAVGGAMRFEAELKRADAMPWDNRDAVVVPTIGAYEALVVYEDDASKRLAERMAVAMNPGEVTGVALPTVRVVAASEATGLLAGADPARLRTVVLLNRSAIPDELSERLDAFAQRGGGVLQFDGIQSGATRVETAAVAIDFDHPALDVFEGASRASLASLRWPGVSNRAIDARARPILMDAMERVIVAEMSRGRGRLIAINSAIDAGPGGLLAEPAFIVLFNELCRYASPGVALPSPKRPGDAKPAALRSGDVQVPEDADVNAEVFTAPGVYAALDASGALTDAFSVSLDPSESDTAANADWKSQADDVVANQNDAAAIASSFRDDPIELWPYLVMLAMGLAATESVLLFRFAGPRVDEGGAG
jgi:hypothetical protein